MNAYLRSRRSSHANSDRPGSPGAIVKRCACGRTYTPAQWEALPDKKVYTIEWGEVHDQRRCPCGSHIIRVLDPGEPDPKPRQQWYRRTDGCPIKIVSVVRGHPAMLVYRGSGVRATTVQLTEFFARFTRKLRAPRAG